MSKTLRSAIQDWQMKHGFTVRALERAGRGESIGKIVAFQIAKTIGNCSDEEAHKLAEEQASGAQPRHEGRPAGRKAKDPAKAAS